jgi:uncharacterized membrane protein
MRIDKKLNEWLQNKLISSEQLQSILNYEEQRKSNFILPGFVWLGIGIIVLGIIAIVAANWMLIPNTIKLIVDFILLAATATACFYWRDRNLLFDGCLLLLILLCLASIGLISQVFQTGGLLYQALIFWAIITFPAVLQAKKPFIARVWAWLTAFAVIYALIDSYDLINDFHFIFITVILGCLWLGLFPIDIKILKFVRQSLLEIGCIGLFLVIYLLEDIVTNSDNGSFLYGYSHLTSGNLLALISYFLLGIITLTMLFLKLSRWQRTLLFPVLFLSLLEFSLWWLGISIPLAISLIITLINLFLLTVYFALKQQHGLYRLGITAIALRMLWLYWFFLGNLITTAGVMVITGFIIIVLARQISKIKTPFLKNIGYTQGNEHE